MPEKTGKTNNKRQKREGRKGTWFIKERMNLNSGTRFREQDVLGILVGQIKMHVKMQTRDQDYGRFRSAQRCYLKP